MRFIKTFINFFSIITLGVLIICAVNYELSENVTMPDTILVQVLISGFVTALPTAVIFMNEYKTKKGYIIAIAAHYILISAIMLVIGCWFDWVSLTVKGVVVMLISVAAVYAFTMLLDYILAKKEADDINEALQRRRGRK
ncbi:MAG: DUF3021 family protein [Oscillospiraceae bacterium]